MAPISILKNGKRKVLHFQNSWFSEFKWLRYSVSKSGGYCLTCLLFANKDNAWVRNAPLIGKPFTKLQHAKGKDKGILTNHNENKYHKMALEHQGLFLAMLKNPSRKIETIIDEKARENEKINIKILESIIDCVMFCGLYGLPLRGHRDSGFDDTVNKGVFKGLVNLEAKHNQILKEHLLKGKKNAQYVSWSVQNELISIIGKQIQEHIVCAIKESETGLFTIISDEVTDCSNNEVISLNVRYVDKNCKIHEDFLEFCGMQRVTAVAISDSILKMVKDAGLDPANMRGQAYDGASVMSAARGTQGLIRKIAPKAMYTHCYAHSLNLSIAASCKNREVKDLVDLINQTFLFLRNSPKREEFFTEILKVYCPENKVEKLKGLCKTRWVERHTCLDTYKAFYEYIVICMDAITNPHLYERLTGGWAWSKEDKIMANGLHHSHTNFKTIITLTTVLYVLEIVKPLATKLQKRSLDIFHATNLISDAESTLQLLRDNIESEFSRWFVEAEKLADKVGANVVKPRSVATMRQQHRSNHPGDTVEDYYRAVLPIQLLDHLQTELKTRFSADNRPCFKIFGVAPESIVKCNVEEVFKELEFWYDDLPRHEHLHSELQRWKRLCSQQQELPATLTEAIVKLADPDVFPNVRALLLIACVLPVTSAEAERSFSTLRRTKTCLRNHMSYERLSGLCLMNIHFNMKINTENVIREFCLQKPRRMFQNAHLLFKDASRDV
ncbi:52 kDa repressor of the inhibitor of the protein kinase-like [Antedon mediterranea]|uniref:52 kDa repressor of the inhibitor of the protein kinase-like n=1 Tax=Antedon mediterranea TaxID=105859 RepID=UPI003AF57AEA